MNAVDLQNLFGMFLANVNMLQFGGNNGGNGGNGGNGDNAVGGGNAAGGAIPGPNPNQAMNDQQELENVILIPKMAHIYDLCKVSPQAQRAFVHDGYATPSDLAQLKHPKQIKTMVETTARNHSAPIGSRTMDYLRGATFWI